MKPEPEQAAAALAFAPSPDWPYWALQGAAILAGQQTLFLQGRAILEGQDKILKLLDSSELQAKVDAFTKTLREADDAVGAELAKAQPKP